MKFFLFVTASSYADYAHGETEEECREKAKGLGEAIVYWAEITRWEARGINLKTPCFRGGAIARLGSCRKGTE